MLTGVSFLDSAVLSAAAAAVAPVLGAAAPDAATVEAPILNAAAPDTTAAETPDRKSVV